MKRKPYCIMDIQNLEDKNILEEFISKSVIVLFKHYDIEIINNQLYIKTPKKIVKDCFFKRYSLYFSNLGGVFAEFKLSNPETDIKSLLEIAIYDTIINKIEEFQDNLYELTNYDFDNCNNVNMLVSYCDNLIKNKLDSITSNSFELLTELSRTTYEKTECSGTIVIDDCKENIIAEIDEKGCMLFNNDNLKRIRKLLQVTNKNISLAVQLSSELNKISQNTMIGFSNFKEANSIKIKFEGKNYLSFWKGRIRLFEYKSGKFKKEFEKIEKKIPSESKVRLDKINVNLYDKLNIFINKLEHTKNFHGALLVFTDDEEFIKNMYKYDRCWRVTENYKINILDDGNCLNEELLLQLSLIDGLVVFDNHGNLKSFATILDGLAQITCDISRGSRYNSSLTYTSYYNKEFHNDYLAVIISEDGPVTIFENGKSI